MTTKSKSKKEKEPKFEEALTGLEEIVGRLEAGELSLDESLSAFEEGVRLSKTCHQHLDEAQKKVETLLADGSKIPLDGEGGSTTPAKEEDTPF